MPRSVWEMNFMDGVSKGITAMESRISQSFARIAVSENQFESQMRGATRATQEAQNSGSGFLNMVKSYVGIAAIGAAFTMAASQTLAFGSNLEQTHVAYEVLLGDHDKAITKINELQKFADVSPFDTQGTFDAGQALLGFGVKAEALIPTMNVLGDLSMGNAVKFKGLVDNYGKLVSAQRANTMDLNQFAIAGVPIWAALEKETGKSGKALRQYVEENGVGVGTINKLLQGMTAEGGMFYGMMQKQSESAAGKWSTFMAGLQNMAGRAFFALEPYLLRLMQFGSDMLPKLESALKSVWHIALGFGTWVSEHTGVLKTAAWIAGSLAIAYGAFQAQLLIGQGIKMAVNALDMAHLFILGMQEGLTVSATLAQMGLNAAFLASPVFWVVGGIAMLTGAVLYLWNHFEGFRKFLFSLWETFKQVFSNIGNFFKLIFSPITDIIQGWKENDFGKMAKGVAQMSFNLTPVGMAVNAAKFGAEGGFTKGVDEAWERGQKRGHESFKESAKKEKSTVGTAYNSAAPTSLDVKNAGGSAEDGKKKGEGTASAHRNIQVSIQQLVGKVEIHVSNAKEGIGNMSNHVTDALIGAVRDFETAIAQE